MAKTLKEKKLAILKFMADKGVQVIRGDKYIVTANLNLVGLEVWRKKGCHLAADVPILREVYDSIECNEIDSRGCIIYP